MAGCNSKDEAPAPAEGIIFSPKTDHQEAYPGQIVTFKFRAGASQAITGFNLRFKLPGTQEYVALPAYPDLTQNANDFAAFQTFEYPLPPSATDVDTEMRFRFSATTAGKSYEQDYVVKMLSHGWQIFKLYSPDATSYFNFAALDLVNSSGVTADAPALTKDLAGITAETNFPLQEVSFNVLKGWVSLNDTRFKLVTTANYALEPTEYGAIYDAIAPELELSGVTTNVGDVAPGTGILAGNQCYIAKVNREGEIHYVGMQVKRAPSTTINSGGITPTLDLTNEYIQLEIKK